MKFGPRHWPVAHLQKIVIPVVMIIVSLVALDQYSKRQIQSRMIFYQDAKDIDLYQGKKDVVFTFGERKARPTADEQYFGLNLHYSRNKGAAFSMFSQMPDQVRVPFFNLLSVLAVIVIYFLFMGSQRESWLLRLGVVFIFAGAVGNFLDRLLLGYVIDFIDVEWHLYGFKHDFAVFNIADVAINIGVFMFIFDTIREWRRSVKHAANPSLPAS